MNRGMLFIISGPSGVGKGALRGLALEKLDRIKFSISCTTRAPRGSEADGVHYHFISKEEFQNRLDNSEFLEHAVVHGDMYGTLRSNVTRELEAGNDVILEIDVQGAFQVREKMQCVLIFVLPPSREELAERLRRRGTESEEKIRTRLKNAEEEMRHAGEYDHIIVNEDLARAALELKEIIIEHRPRMNELIRPDWDTYFLMTALIASTRSTCVRRQVGAVITRNRHIVSTGYNGAPQGTKHCSELGCLREQLGVPSGERHEICRGSHAELNAIAQAAKIGVSTQDASIICTHEPCSFCTKAILNAGIKEIIFLHPYPDKLAHALRDEAGIAVKQLEQTVVEATKKYLK